MLALKKPKLLHWTVHARAKMRQYALSEARVRRVLHSPVRIEEGIAEDTIAMMQPAAIKTSGKDKTWTQEIWVMIAETPKSRRVVSAWRYPGQTKLGTPLPTEVVRQLRAQL
ncbi:MAG: hypothetical protein A2855_01995 [Candidatus Liptonbacteria bacterium RIFCSPHIGHO2_01_FULL_57_28]|uniref:DUF4258 domain-containing protein n=1 Tax=Candidatus Liptonbacteria bacterium RIFCSPHIGHO2_01_FULL_57_28 TaxID=1798647 RepID=A0A1G2CD58_9BACT|nr:MAG: hypothetical protein A2855_01995 [Candidatus Liptonbacteria bacterium RIFCSPHIGHO2_01_FULL_57_28]